MMTGYLKSANPENGSLMDLGHGWLQDVFDQAIRYGGDEVNANQGFVRVGECFEKPGVAVEAIGDWQLVVLRRAQSLWQRASLIDSGRLRGSNSYRSCVWKA